MARLTWVGSTFNNASISDLYLEDSLGSQFGLLNALGGDIALNPAKVGRFSSKVRGFVVSRLAGEVEDGSISIPLKIRSITATFGAGNPSLLDIIAQNSAGTSYVPFAAVTLPATGAFPARTIYADPLVKTWKIVMLINTGNIDGAVYSGKLTAYPMIPTVDQTIANVGADSTTTLVGTIDDPAGAIWEPL